MSTEKVQQIIDRRNSKVLTVPSVAEEYVEEAWTEWQRVCAELGEPKTIEFQDMEHGIWLSVRSYLQNTPCSEADVDEFLRQNAEEIEDRWGPEEYERIKPQLLKYTYWIKTRFDQYIPLREASVDQVQDFENELGIKPGAFLGGFGRCKDEDERTLMENITPISDDDGTETARMLYTAITGEDME